MRAMILAAGRGKRMGALTACTPKPLLRIHDQYLIEYSIFSLKAAGIKEVVINISYHSEQIKSALGDGKYYGMSFYYSEEQKPLETGGGIVKALPILGDDPFLVISSDIIADYPLVNILKKPKGLAHLVMVPNPIYHEQGDFGLKEGWVDQAAEPKFTFGNLAIYHPDLFLNCQPECFPLRKLLLPAINNQQVTGEYYQGLWFNIGTPEDIECVQEDSNLRHLPF